MWLFCFCLSLLFQIRGRRHLVFASDRQIEVLTKSKTWYIDGTFKLCRQPFSQLLTVNAFVRNDDYVKQVPLVFVVMSGRKKRDYRALLETVISLLLNEPKVKKIVRILDFEKAMWSAIRQVMPNLELMGCSFHWTQALWRKVSMIISFISMIRVGLKKKIPKRMCSAS